MVFGINTNTEETEEEISQISSSIKKEFGISINNQKIIEEFCNQWEKKFLERVKP